MNILFICHRFPYPPVGGAKVRAFHMIRHLSEQGHKVTVCSLARSQDEVEEGRGIAPFCEGFEMATVRTPVQVLRMVASLPTPGSASEAYFFSPELEQRIKRLIDSRNWDLIIVHCSSVARYVEDVTHSRSGWPAAE